MASTLYQFKADLQGLVDLENKLKQAKAELEKLKKGTKEYEQQSKKLKGIDKQFNEQAKSMRNATKEANNMNTAGRRLVNTFKSAAVAIASAFAVRAIVGAVRGAIQVFAEFEQKMDAVKAISGASNVEFEKLKASAEKLGKTTVFTAAQVAGLQEEFARLGFSAQEIRRVSAATLDLAAATGESLAASAQTAGNVLRAFNMEAESTQRVTDVMSMAFTNSALNLEKFKESMKFVAPVARAAGFTLEETSTILMKLADNGLSGSIAGNGLKNILMRLGDENSKLAKKFGGTVDSMPELVAGMKRLKEEGFGLTDAVELLDKRSAPAFLALMNSIESLEPGVDILNEAEGATARMAAIRLDNLAGDMTLMKSAMEGLGIAIGEELNLGMRETIYAITRFTQRLSESEGFLKGVRIASKLLVAVLASLAARLVGMGLKSFVNMLISAAVGMKDLAMSTRSANIAQKGLKATLASTPWGAIAQGITFLVTSLISFANKADEAEMAQRRLNDAMNDSLKGILQLNEGDKDRAEMMRQFANDFPALIDLIDLELASNAQLALLKDDMRNEDLKHTQEQIANAKARMQAAKDNLVVQQETAEKARKFFEEEIKQNHSRNSDEYIRAQTKVTQTQSRMFEIQKEIKAEMRLINQIKKNIQDHIKDDKRYKDILITNDATYRQKMNQQALEELSKFRKMKESEQTIELARNQERLEYLKAHAEYNHILAQGTDEFGNVSEQAKTNALNFLNDLDSNFKTKIESSTKSVSQISIELDVFRKLINNLTGALKKSGDGFKLSGISGVVLQKTKDNFKELAKIMDDIITDQYDRLIAKADTHLEVETTKYEKEVTLMQTNKRNLEKLENSFDAELLSKTIKKNRQKYDVLKNLDTAHYNNLISEKEQYVGEMQNIITKMLEEEKGKIETNNALIEELQRQHSRNVQKIKQDESLRKAEAEQRFIDTGIEATMKGELKLFAKWNALRDSRKAAEKAQIDWEVAEMDRKESLINQHYTNVHNALVQQLMNGEITQQQFDNRRIKNDKAMTDAILNNRKEHQSNIDEINTKSNEADVQLQAQKIQAIGQYYQMAFDALNTFLTNQFELEMQDINERHDIKSQDLEDQMNEQLVANEGNAQAQEDIREVFAERQRVNDQKREEELRKIKKKQFMMDKVNKIATAVINTALAITMASAQTGIGAAVAAPIMAALGAAQIAAIASQKFVGKKGGVIPAPEDKFAKGGMVVGKSHAQGGEKFSVGGRVVELEGGEAVINKRSTAMFRPQLSAMNEAGGGVKFQDGGIMPGVSNKVNEAGLGNMALIIEELGHQVVSGVNSKQVTVTEANISNAQSNVNVLELQSSIF